MTTMSSPLRFSSRRIQSCQSKPFTHNLQQTRNATLIKRPKRPYTFTQLVTLTDGSSFLQRTTSPVPVYRSNKDIRNSPLWNPSDERLANMEKDEAGKLSAFRTRFGRNWDQESKGTTVVAKQAETESEGPKDDGQSLDLLMDLISQPSRQAETKKDSKVSKPTGKSKK